MFPPRLSERQTRIGYVVLLAVLAFQLTGRQGATPSRGCFVFNGHFEIPLAASYSHAQKAQFLLREKRPQEALAEAQQALALAPDAVKPNVLVGDVLVALKRPDEARPYYEKALTLAKAVEPEFQLGWVDSLEEKLHTK